MYICTYLPLPALAEIHSSSLALNVFTSLHIIILTDKILASTKCWHRQNIGGVKILAASKCWRRQNIGVNKMLASTKYSRRQNVCVDKIFALTKWWRWQNIRVDKMLASTKYPPWQNLGVNKSWQMRGSISLLFWPGRIHSSWLLPDLADVLLLLPEGVNPSTCSHWSPCSCGRALSRTVPAYCTGPPCRKCHKYWRWQNIGARQDFTNFAKL